MMACLSAVIAVLAVLVIGLAAGTGVATRNYRSERDRYQDLQASYSALVANATGSAASGKATGSPDYSRISNGCSEDNDSTTGSFYRPDCTCFAGFLFYLSRLVFVACIGLSVRAVSAPLHTPLPNLPPLFALLPSLLLSSLLGSPLSAPLCVFLSLLSYQPANKYITEPVFGKPRFTMYCNKDASNTPFYSLFTADFNGCMSACASWNSYNASNSVCEAVSFIPLWSDLVAAVKGKAPGDCYLKPGPQSVQKLQTPNIGTECHAAILGHNATAGS